jgi:hypothetical protein
MPQRCTEELKRIVPSDPETRRTCTLFEGGCSPWRSWAGWLAIATAVASALLALTRLFRTMGYPAAAGAVAGMLCCAGLSALPALARADAPQPQSPRESLDTWPIDDNDPEKSIPSDKDKNAQPLEFGYWIQDIALRAERASKRGDHAAAVKYYAALAKVVPSRAIGFIKMCDEYEAMGDHNKAIDSCGQALLRDGLTVKDYSHFIQVVLAKPGTLSDKETSAVERVLGKMRTDKQSQAEARELGCEVGVRTSNIQDLRICTTELVAIAPGDPKTITYQWVLAIQEGKFDEAKQLIEEARAQGMKPEGIESMQRETEARITRHRHVIVWFVTGALLIAAAALAGTTLLHRRRTLQSA